MWCPLSFVLAQVDDGRRLALHLAHGQVLRNVDGQIYPFISVGPDRARRQHAVVLKLLQASDFDVKRAVHERDEAVFLPTDRPAAHFDVLEDVAGEIQLLRTTETFMEATDFVFDEVLWQREPGDLQIVRVDAGRREVVWSFRPGEAATQSREDMLSVFGYAVGQWEDMHQHPGADIATG